MKHHIIALSIAFTSILFMNTFAYGLNIVGTWRLVSQKIIHPNGSVTTTDSPYLNQIKVYTPKMFVTIGERMIPQLNNQKLVVSSAGGHYTLDGDVYEEFTEFATYKGYKDMKVKFKLTMENGKMHTVGGLSGSDGIVTTYDEWYIKVDAPAKGDPLTGSWKAISQKVNNPDGSVYTSDSSSVTVRKLFTPGMVIVLREQVIPQADNEKLIISVAGGSYSLKQGEYVESIDFASYQNFENMKVKFKLEVENGKPHTTGTITDGDGQVAVYDEWFVKTE